jgi:hypothetical protein
MRSAIIANFSHRRPARRIFCGKVAVAVERELSAARYSYDRAGSPSKAESGFQGKKTKFREVSK